MYSGLEVRVPYCDRRISGYLYTVPWEYKDYMGREKGLLRTAFEGYLPKEVLWRKKSPYPKTQNPTYLKKVSNKLKNLLAEPENRIFSFVERKALENLLTEAERDYPWYGQLMKTPQTMAYFLQIGYWIEKFNVKIC